MAEKTNKRRNDIVFLNILFCLLVIFIHISSEVVTKMPKSTLIFKTVYSAQRLSSFVVQGFLLLSGVKLFLNKSTKINYAKFYLTRFLRVIVPYVLWVVIYYFYFVSEEYFVFSVDELIRFILNGKLSAHFYFVIILVQFDLLAPLWMFVFKRGNAVIHIAFSLMITVISLQYLMPVLTTVFPSIPDIDMSNCFLRYQIYWTAGCMIGRYYEEFRSFLKNNKIYICVIFLLCAALNVAASLATVGYPPVWLEFIHMLYCMAAILFFYMIAQGFTGVGAVVLKPLGFLDRASYTIYLIHCLVLVIFDNYMNDIGILSVPQRFVLRAAAVYGISIVFCLVWQIIKYPVAKLIRKS